MSYEEVKRVVAESRASFISNPDNIAAIAGAGLADAPAVDGDSDAFYESLLSNEGFMMALADAKVSEAPEALRPFLLEAKILLTNGVLKESEEETIGDKASFSENKIKYTHYDEEDFTPFSKEIDVRSLGDNKYVTYDNIDYTIEDGALKTTNNPRSEFITAMRNFDTTAPEVAKSMAELFASNESKDIQELAYRFKEIVPDDLFKLPPMFDEKGQSFMHHLAGVMNSLHSQSRTEELAAVCDLAGLVIAELRQRPGIALEYLSLKDRDGRSFADKIKGMDSPSTKQILDSIKAIKLASAPTQTTSTDIDTHTASVHKSTDKSFRAVATRAAGAWGLDVSFVETGGMFHLAGVGVPAFNQKITEQLNNSLTILQNYKNMTDVEALAFLETSSIGPKQTEAEAQVRLEFFRHQTDLVHDYLTKAKDGVKVGFGSHASDPSVTNTCGLSITQVMGVCSFLLEEEEHALIKATDVPGKDLAAVRFANLTSAIYDVVRGYNIDDGQDTPDRYIFNPTAAHNSRCAGGTINSMANFMQPINSLMEVKLMNFAVAQDVLKDVISRHLAGMYDGASEEFKQDLALWKITGAMPLRLNEMLLNLARGIDTPAELQRIFAEFTEFGITQKPIEIMTVSLSGLKMSDELKRKTPDIDFTAMLSDPKFCASAPSFIKTATTYRNILDIIAENFAENPVALQEILNTRGVKIADLMFSHKEHRLALLTAVYENGQDITVNQNLIFLLHEFDLQDLKSVLGAKYNDFINHAFLQAAAQGNIVILGRLLAAGADLNVLDRDGNTPLLRAVNGNMPEIVDKLLAAGADLNVLDRDGNTPLLRAVNGNMPEIVDKLLAAGVDPNVRGYLGETALMSAVQYSGPEIVDKLLAAGADPNVRDYRGQTALMSAAISKMTARAFNKSELLDKLLAAGASVNVRDDQGETLLMLVIKYGDVYCNSQEMVDKFLAAGASVNVRDNQGWTALMHVVKYGYKLEDTAAIVDKLIAAADDDAKIFARVKRYLHLKTKARQEMVVIEGDIDDGTKIGSLNRRVDIYDRAIDALLEKLRYSPEAASFFSKPKNRLAMDESQLFKLTRIFPSIAETALVKTVVKGEVAKKSSIGRAIAAISSIGRG